MSDWLAVCDERDRRVVGALVRSLDPAGSVERAVAADIARRTVLESAPGELGVVVGPLAGGVSEVNLAAALARDGNARCVVLAGHGVSGSLRSRAARAGVDRVVDLDDVAGVGGASDAGGAANPAPVGEAARRETPRAEEPTARRTGGRHLAGQPADKPRDRAAGQAIGQPPGSQTGQPRRETPAPLGDVSDRAPVVVFCSGRGGVGKTSVVAVAAACAASWGMRVCALDLDLSCGNLYGCFGLGACADLTRIVCPRDGAVGAGAPGASAPGSAPNTVAPGLRERSGDAAEPVRVLGPCELPETAELVAPHVGELISGLAREFDLVLVDTSAALTDAVAQAVQLADRLVLVCDDRPGATSSLARTSGLAVRLGVARTRMVRLENRVSPRARREEARRAAGEGLEAAARQRVLDGGAEVRDLLGAGRAAELVDSGSPFAESTAALMARLLSELGRLPEHEGAVRALADAEPRRRPLFGFGRVAS